MSCVLMSVSGARLWLVAVFLMLAAVIGMPLQAQQRYISFAGKAEVPIVKDNLVLAKQEVLKKAQKKALLAGVSSLIAPFWLRQSNLAIKNNILAKSEQFIVSFQAIVLKPARNRNRYLAEIEIQADLLQLENALRILSLPLRSQPLKSLQPLYAKQDDALQQKNLRLGLIKRLSPRLRLFRFKLASPRQLSHRQVEKTFKASSSEERKKILGSQLQKPLLLLMFTKQRTKQPASLSLLMLAERSAAVLARQKIVFNSKLLSNLENFSLEQQELFFKQLAKPLVATLLPTNVKLTSPPSLDEQHHLQLAVKGLKNLSDEKDFARTFFAKGSLFEGFALARIAPKTVVFSGNYRGLPEYLPSRINNRSFGAFKISQAELLADTITIQAQRKKKNRHRYLTVLADETHGEVENNGWFESANRLPFKTTVSGSINARADADFFIGKSLAGSLLKISWQREGRSRIQPILRVYSQQRNVLLERAIYVADAEFKVQLPKQSGEFYLELSDRFGHVPAEAGGQIKLNYQLRVF